MSIRSGAADVRLYVQVGGERGGASFHLSELFIAGKLNPRCISNVRKLTGVEGMIKHIPPTYL